MALRLGIVVPHDHGPYSGIGRAFERAGKRLGIEACLTFSPLNKTGATSAAVLRDWKPDVVLFPESAYLWSRAEIGLIFGLRRELSRRGVPFVGLHHDLPWTWPWPDRRAARVLWDHCGTCEPVCLSLLGPKGFYFPHAYDDEAVLTPVKPQRGIGTPPLLVIGQGFTPRQDWIAPVCGQLRKLGMVIIGHQWGLSVPTFSVPYDEARWLAKKAKLVINIGRGRNGQMPRQPVGGWHAKDTFWNPDPLGPALDDERAPYRLSDLQAMNERVFHYSALGTLQVVDWRAYIAEALPELPTVTGPNDLVETCRRLLADPKERRERMAKTWARVEGHTYLARLVYLLKTVGVADLSAKAPAGSRTSPWDFSPRKEKA